MNNNLRIAALIALALGASTAEAAKFYKWTDEQGATHYTAEPPPAGSQGSEVRVQTKPVTSAKEAAPAASTPKGASTQTKPKDKGSSKDQKSEQPAGSDQYADRCKSLRANLQALEEHARVKETDAKGEVRLLTDEEKNARLDDTRRQIKAFCE